jgi:hypothetical protein
VLWTSPDGRWLQRSRTHQSFLAEEPAAAVVVDKDRERRADRRFDLPDGGGEWLAPRARTVTHAMCEAFSGPSRNYHTDREMAQALGFPDIVVQGMLSVCFVADAMALRFGDAWAHGGTLDVRLVNVVGPATRSPPPESREVVPEGRVSVSWWTSEREERRDCHHHRHRQRTRRRSHVDPPSPRGPSAAIRRRRVEPRAARPYPFRIEQLNPSPPSRSTWTVARAPTPPMRRSPAARPPTACR